MLKCIELAELAKARGDSPVGAILVKNNEIIAQGIEAGKTKQDITYHAEIEAIRDIRVKLGITDLSEYTMYSTHEPCIMCSYVIRHHKINTIVWGVSSGKIGGYTSGYKILQDLSVEQCGKAPKIVMGIAEDQCRELNNLY